MNKLVICCLVALAICCAVSGGFPYNDQLYPVAYDQQVDESAFAPSVLAAPAQDLEGAATGHGHHGRVQIKVYRGPSHHGHHDHFAPHGFWVKQPADDHH